MFTGIITNIGTIIKAEKTGDLRLEIASDFPLETIKLGDSIACNGVCLTVVDYSTINQQPATVFAVQLSAETIACSAPNFWQVGNRINLERALKIGDTLDGHLVSGHVDGFATIQTIEKFADSNVISMLAPPALGKFIAQKGSVTLDGVSLTVNKVVGNQFWVNIIPHTWQNTTLGERKIGDSLNLEIDLIARYVERLLAAPAVNAAN
jgi:riboflavin synthase